MNESTFIIIILFEISVGFFAYYWTDEIEDVFWVIYRYLQLAFACTLWIMHFGSQSYVFTYKLKGEEDYRIVELHSVDEIKREK